MMLLSKSMLSVALVGCSLALPSAALADGSPSTPTDISASQAAATVAQTDPSATAPSADQTVAGTTVSPTVQKDGSSYQIDQSTVDGSISANAANGFTIASSTGDASTTSTDTSAGSGSLDGMSINGGNSSSGDQTSLTVKPLDVASTATAPVVAGGDSLVYADTAPATDSVVRPTVDGVETFEQIRDQSAPEKFSYAMDVPDGGKLQLKPDGSVSVINSNGDDIADVGAPTATDANGQSIPADFTVDGSVLTLHVMHRQDGTAYPVIVDPRFSIHWDHLDIYFNRTETRYVGHGGAWALGGAIGATIGSVGGAPGWIIGGAAVGGALASIGADIVDTHLSHGKCLDLNLVWVGWPWNLGPHIQWYGC